MQRSGSWVVGFLLVSILCAAAGCTAFMPGTPGDAKAGTGRNTADFQKQPGSGFGPVSKSAGTSGTETWQVTLTGSESWDSKTTSEGTTTVSSLSENLQGNFPVTVAHSLQENGDDYQSATVDEMYPVSGTARKTDHITDTLGMKEDREAGGSFQATDFSFDFGPDGTWWVDMHSTAPTTGSDKLFEPKGYRGEDYPGFSDTTPVSEDETVEFACSSDGSGSDTFPGGNRDFHRDGAAYSISCQGPLDDATLGQTGQISLKLTLDPEYVGGPVTPQATETLPSLVPQTPETLPSLVPSPADTLPSLVPSPTETLPSLVPQTPETLPPLVPPTTV